LAGEENSCGADNYADKQQQRFHFIAPLICGLKDLAPLCLLLTQSGHLPAGHVRQREAPPKRGNLERIYLRTFRLPADSLPLSEIIS